MGVSHFGGGRFEEIDSMEAEFAENARREMEDGRGDPGAGPSRRNC